MGRIAVESAFMAKPLHKISSSELQPYQQQHCNKDCPREAQETWVRKKNQGNILGYHDVSSIFQNQQNYYNPILATLVFYKKQTKDFLRNQRTQVPSKTNFTQLWFAGAKREFGLLLPDLFFFFLREARKTIQILMKHLPSFKCTSIFLKHPVVQSKYSCGQLFTTQL